MKEVKTIERLTEKLKKEKDVSQEEADLIYMLRRIYEAYCISTFARSSNVRARVFVFQNLKPHIYDSAIGFDFTKSFLNPMCDAFREWYKIVSALVASGKTGYFVTTLPVNDLCRRWKKEERDTAGFMKSTISRLSEEDRVIEVSGEQAKEIYLQIKNLLCADALFRKNELHSLLIFSRYGLLSRLKRSMNDVLFVQKMTEKLRSEGDITLDEADVIFTVIKFVQTIKTRKFQHYIEKSEAKMQANELKGELSNWFKAVYDTVKSGRTGNFLYTLPIDGLTDMGHALVYIRKIQKLLPDQFLAAKFFKKIDPPDLAGVFFDSEKNMLMSQRYGVVQKEVDKYDIFPDEYGSFCRTEGVKSGDFILKKNYETFISGICDLTSRIRPSALKFEYLNRKNISPVCLLCRSHNSKDGYYVAYKKEDKGIVEKIFNIPNDKLWPELPGISDEDDFLKILDLSLNVLEATLCHFDFTEDDSWVDIER